MNYRHAFHAGNFADVVKHLIVSRIIEYLKQKPGAFRVLDTHAGIGLYDLGSNEAERSPEWVDGIQRLFDKGLPGAAGELAKPYLDAVKSFNSAGKLRYYPGSPLIIRRLLREQDRLFALELHPADANTLAKHFTGDIQARITRLDGWAALGTHVPPKEKRGLVLIDPPFEEPNEFGRLVDGLVKAYKRFPSGVYALWYPVKDQADIFRFGKELRATGIPKMLRVELTVAPASDPPRLNGTGMIIVNPPFTLDAEIKVLLPALAKLLGQHGEGKYVTEWLARE